MPESDATSGPVLSVPEQRAIVAVSSFDPILQDAGQEVVSYLPKPEDGKPQFGILAILAAIAAICDILTYCHNRNNLTDGAALKSRATYPTYFDRRNVKRAVRKVLAGSEAEHGIAGWWKGRCDAEQLTDAILTGAAKADTGRLEAIRTAALARASLGGVGPTMKTAGPAGADKPMEGRPDGAGEEREREDIEAVGRGDAGDIGESKAT